MIFYVGLLVSLMTSAAEMQQAIIDATQAKQHNYLNLFDACLCNKDFFERMREKKQVSDVYFNYLKAGTALFEKSFKEFVQRHNNDVLNIHSFEEFKKTIHAKIDSADQESCVVIATKSESAFDKALKIALIEERQKAISKLYEYPTISTILNVRITELRRYNQSKGNVNINQNLYANQNFYESLNRFCLYAKLFDDCYEMIENLH
jgi:hypothetical protein